MHFLTPLIVVFILLISNLASVHAGTLPWFSLRIGNDGIGGCDQYNASLDSAYDEAINMARSADAAISKLQQHEPFEGRVFDQLSRDEKRELQKYGYYKQIASTILGLDLDAYGYSDQIAQYLGRYRRQCRLY